MTNALASLLPGLSRTGLVLPNGLAFQEWARTVHAVGELVRVTPWAAGDLLLYGEAHFGEASAQILDAFGFSPETLGNFARVCRAFEHRRRRERPLTFSHHAELVTLPEAEQERWLDECLRHNPPWTRTQLREALGKRTPKAFTNGCPPHRCACGVQWGGKAR